MTKMGLQLQRLKLESLWVETQRHPNLAAFMNFF